MSISLNAKTLRTRRLVLRAMRLEDAGDFHAIYSDPETMKYWSDKPAIDIEESEQRVREDVEAMARGKMLFWSVCFGEEVIGKCVLFQFSMRNKRAELGYVMRRSFWGQGLMTEALAEVIRHAFEDLDLHRLEADTDPKNLASLRLLDKLGFEKEGLFRDRWFVYDQWQDSVMLGLIKPSWEHGRQG